MTESEKNEPEEGRKTSPDSANSEQSFETTPNSEGRNAGADTTSSTPVDKSEKPDNGDTTDELPEDEELTPELVEEEAIRGDFMLRWASIFLAVLFGFSQIADTQSLVHIRSGDDLRSSGFIPSGEDSFAYSLDGKSVANVSWLFDHVVSLVYAVGGDSGLTIFKALMAGIVAYLLSLISVPGMPTWWSSICCVFAVAACSIDFVPVTDLVTLLGVTTTLLLLHQFQVGTLKGGLWKLPLTIAIWTNFDSRAYLGVLAIALFGLGLQLRKSSAENAGEAPGANPRTIWQAAGIGLVALLINPAPLASALSVVTTYTVEYPAMVAMKSLTGSPGFLDGRTEYYPVWIPAVFDGFEFAYLSGLALLLIAVVVLLNSRHKEDLPWLFTLVGFGILGAIALRELPVAALVAAAAAGTTAQRWYGRTFRQEYSVATAEVLFSRGGRAITVFAMAFLGFCVVADRLPTRTPLGMGFEPDLKTTMQSLEEQFAELPGDARVLPTRMTEGDLLIWHGHQTFLDSRARLFGRYADQSSAIYRFDAMRKSLLVEEPPEGVDASDQEAAAETAYNPNWKQDYDELKISHVMVRLSPPGIPYSIVLRFQRNPNWLLTARGPSAAFFEFSETPPTNPAWDPRQLAFRVSEDSDVERFDFARELDFYQQYLYESRATQSAPLRESLHHYNLDCQASPQYVYNVAAALANEPNNPEFMVVLGRMLGGPLLAIRRANEALALEPQNANAHRLLGLAYMRLSELESGIAAAFEGANLQSLRYLQAVMALQQSVLLEPDSAGTWRSLVELYQSQGRIGLAFECIEKQLALEEQIDIQTTEDEERLRSLYERRNAWKDQLDRVQGDLETQLAGQMPEDPQEHAFQKLTLVQRLQSQGLVRMALNVANDNIDLLRPIPHAEIIRGQLLLEVGEMEDAYAVLNQLAAVVRDSQQSNEFTSVPWHQPVALSNVAKGAYPSAIEIWGEQLSVLAGVENKDPQMIHRMTATLPFVPNVESQIGNVVPTWPGLHLQETMMPLQAIPRGRAQPTMMIAMANLESGNIANARFILRQMVEEGGEHPYRALADIYFGQMSDDATELIAAATFDPWEDFEFPEAADEDAVNEKDTDDSVPEESANESQKKSTDAESKPADSATDESVDKSSEADSPSSDKSRA